MASKYDVLLNLANSLYDRLAEWEKSHSIEEDRAVCEQFEEFMGWRESEDVTEHRERNLDAPQRGRKKS